MGSSKSSAAKPKERGNRFAGDSTPSRQPNGDLILAVLMNYWLPSLAAGERRVADESGDCRCCARRL